MKIPVVKIAAAKIAQPIWAMRAIATTGAAPAYELFVAA
jgi:hypothetical protein